MLDLLGRHPLLTIKQLADLLALTPRRARQLRQSLVEQSLVRLLTTSDLGPRTPSSR
jgi:DNA-binding IclR family transcriptional regulator